MIKIPFKKEMKALILAGKKRCTSRNRKYGDTGDEFIVGKSRYMITFVVRRSLKYVADFLYEDEGFESRDAFIRYWNMIHPGKKFDPNQKVWVHYFMKV